MTTSRIELGTAPLPSSTMRDVRDWARILVGTLARGVIATILGLALWAAAPAVIGWTPTTVMTGSMEPRLSPGDVVVSRPVAETSLHVGQVILYDDPDMPGELRLHRFHKVGTDGQIITKGDANPQADSTPIARSAVHGVAFIRVPYLGTPIMWLRDGEWQKLIALVIALAGLALLSTIDASLRRDPSSSSSSSDGAPGATDDGLEARGTAVTRLPSVTAPVRTRREIRRRARRVRRLRRTGAALAIVLVAGGMGFMVPAKALAAGFGAATVAPTSTFAAGKAWACLGRTVPATIPTATFSYGLNESSTGSLATTAVDDVTGTQNGVLSATGVTRSATVSCPSAGTASPYVTTDGATGSIVSPTVVTAPTSFSTEAWFRTSTTNGGKVIGFGNATGSGSTTSDRQIWMTTGGKLVAGITQTGLFGTAAAQTTATTKAYNDGVWHHAVMTYDGTNVVLYVDGVSVGTTSRQFLSTGTLAYNGVWHIGGDTLSTAWTGSNGNGFFAGSIDDATVYSSVLSAAQVTTLYGLNR